MRLSALAAGCALVAGGVVFGLRPWESGRQAAASAAGAPAGGGVAAAAARPAAAPGAGDAAPSRREQDAAVARLAALGLPVFRGGGNGRYVALTFDDGPGPYTETALRALRTSRAHATFFLVGRNLAQWPDLPRRELALGALGDHTWNHLELTRLAPAEARAEMARTQQAAARAGGTPIRLFRPPYGARNGQVDRTARDLGMLQVLWSIDSGDSAGATWDQMLAGVKREMHPGAIVLFHENRGQTLKALNRLLPWLRRQGYRAVSVPELMVLDPPSEGRVRSDAARWAGVRMAGAPG